MKSERQNSTKYKSQLILSNTCASVPSWLIPCKHPIFRILLVQQPVFKTMPATSTLCPRWHICCRMDNNNMGKRQKFKPEFESLKEDQRKETCDDMKCWKSEELPPHCISGAQVTLGEWGLRDYREQTTGLKRITIQRRELQIAVSQDPRREVAAENAVSSCVWSDHKWQMFFHTSYTCKQQD